MGGSSFGEGLSLNYLPSMLIYKEAAVLTPNILMHFEGYVCLRYGTPRSLISVASTVPSAEWMPTGCLSVYWMIEWMFYKGLIDTTESDSDPLKIC